jgi:hypothetical protein
MHLSRLTVVAQKLIVHAVKVTLLFAGSTEGILVSVLDDLAFGVAVGEELGEGNSRGVALDFGSSGLLLLGLPLLLFLRS